jgi:EpsI family protein
VNIWIKITLLVTVFAATYIDSILSLVSVWNNRPSYSHGFLIPFISLYIVYFDRNKLSGTSINPNLKTGVLLTITACFMLLVGRISSTEALLHLSILTALPGLVLMILGTGYVKKLAFPLAYLIFMVPVIDIFLSRLHWPSQVFSAGMAAELLNFINIPAVVDKQIIHLPNTSLEVAKACSGVRFFVSILALGIPLAHLTQKSMIRKYFLVFFGIMIVIPVNVLRVLIISIWAFEGGEVLHGPFHVLQGLFVAVVGFAFLIIMAYVLSRIPYKGNNETESKKTDAGKMISENTKLLNKPWIIAVMILLMTGGHIYFYKPKPVVLGQELQKLPHKIGSWEAEPKAYVETFININNADTRMSGSYWDKLGRSINVDIAYFESQDRNREIINYRLDWLYENTREIEIQLPDRGSVKINKAVIRNARDTSLIMYWYDVNGKIVANNIKAKVLTGMNGLVNRKTNGAIVMVSYRLNNFEAMEQALDYETGFVRELLQVLPKYAAL